MFDQIIEFIRSLYPGMESIPLHAPVFAGNEKKYLADCIDTTYVSYVGEYVNRFEQMICAYTGCRFAVAVVNGTCALQTALYLAGVRANDEVLTQALTFVATANAITHAGAVPVFIDSEKERLGMNPAILESFLKDHAVKKSEGCFNRITGRKIACCVPVHIFGHPAFITEINEICSRYHIPVIEDAAESIGSRLEGKHTGTFGLAGILSFNGNKTITTGGGGMIITDNENIALQARHLTTTAKVKHPWDFYHDQPGFNYRMTNVCAAIGCAQMEKIDLILGKKRAIAEAYKSFFSKLGINFFTEKPGCVTNYWLNTILLANREERDLFIEYSNSWKVTTRPAWVLMHKLPMYKDCLHIGLHTAQWLEDRIVNIPSSVPPINE